jgi:hypothetical protein
MKTRRSHISDGIKKTLLLFAVIFNNTFYQMGELFYVDRENIVTCISVAREQLAKHVPAKKNSWPAIGKGLSIARQRTCKQLSAGCVTKISDVCCLATSNNIRSLRDNFHYCTLTVFTEPLPRNTLNKSVTIY